MKKKTADRVTSCTERSRRNPSKKKSSKSGGSVVERVKRSVSGAVSRVRKFFGT